MTTTTSLKCRFCGNPIRPHAFCNCEGNKNFIKGITKGIIKTKKRTAEKVAIDIFNAGTGSIKTIGEVVE